MIGYTAAQSNPKLDKLMAVLRGSRVRGADQPVHEIRLRRRLTGRRSDAALAARIGPFRFPLKVRPDRQFTRQRITSRDPSLRRSRCLRPCWRGSFYGIKCVIAPEVPSNLGTLARSLSPRPKARSSTLCARRQSRPATSSVTCLPDAVMGYLEQALPSHTLAESGTMWNHYLRGATGFAGECRT
jgi:hypothetical protein